MVMTSMSRERGREIAFADVADALASEMATALGRDRA
jgi:hypothetical protein